MNIASSDDGSGGEEEIPGCSGLKIAEFESRLLEYAANMPGTDAKGLFINRFGDNDDYGLPADPIQAGRCRQRVVGPFINKPLGGFLVEVGELDYSEPYAAIAEAITLTAADVSGADVAGAFVDMAVYPTIDSSAASAQMRQ